MKKSILNVAITMAMSTAILSVSALNTQAYADTGYTDKQQITDTSLSNSTSNNETSDENYMYSGMGIGAAAGTAVAGPAGFVIGGIIGAFIGSNQTVSDTDVDIDTDSNQTSTLANNTENTEEVTVSIEQQNETNEVAAFSSDASSAGIFSDSPDVMEKSVQVAELGTKNSITDNSASIQQDKLLNILTADLSLDVYFRSGSTDIETFYPARLAAIADLLNAMNTLEIHLDGYTDRRGNKDQNITLANQRIENVRQQLIDAGVDENRIISKAFGEMKMVSAAGDLDGYTFDRKVVIRFEKSTIDSIHSMKTALSKMETKTSADTTTESVSPVVADASNRF